MVDKEVKKVPTEDQRWRSGSGLSYNDIKRRLLKDAQFKVAIGSGGKIGSLEERVDLLQEEVDSNSPLTYEEIADQLLADEAFKTSLRSTIGGGGEEAPTAEREEVVVTIDQGSKHYRYSQDKIVDGMAPCELRVDEDVVITYDFYDIMSDGSLRNKTLLTFEVYTGYTATLLNALVYQEGSGVNGAKIRFRAGIDEDLVNQMNENHPHISTKGWHDLTFRTIPLKFIL